MSGPILADDEQRREEKLAEERLKVRFLIDENLPRSLKDSLRDLYPDCKHVSDLELLGAPSG